MTLTYPDEILHRDRWIEKTKEESMDEKTYKDVAYLHMTQHRWVFWRYLEKYLDRKLPAIWRIEFKPRLSGNRIGKPMPHLHVLIMTQDYIPWQEVKWAWMNTIGERFVNVDVRAVYDPEVCMHYLSKYIGKDELVILENDAYLDSLPYGRQWGYMRKNLVKLSDKWTGRYFETDDLASLRYYATPGKVELIDSGMCSFTLIGPRAREIGEILVGIPLANQGEST